MARFSDWVPSRHRLGRSALALAALIGAGTARAQSLLDRPPDMSGDWVGAPGTLYFHFVHRFSTSGAPERKVSNVPTFLLAAALPWRLLAGFNYSTNSTLAPRYPNEWEAFARWAPLDQDNGAPFDLGGQVGYNNAADGVDAEVSAARRIGAATARSGQNAGGSVSGGGGTPALCDRGRRDDPARDIRRARRRRRLAFLA